MGFFSNWPFSNLHNLNLDWIVEQVKKLTILSEQIWERVKPIPGGDPSTITAAQAYNAASLAQDTADRASQSAATANTSINNHTDNKNNPHEVTPQQIGAEPSIGILDISKGGTGANNPVTARALLGARADFTILPVSDGGTGSSTPAGALSALGARADFSILPVSDGGTGSNTPEGARAALGITPDNIGAIPKGGGSVTGFLAFDGSNGLSWRFADGASMLLRPYVEGNIFQFVLTPQNGSAYSPFSIDSAGAVCVSNLAVGTGQNGLILWYSGSGCGIAFKVNGIDKCSISLNADGTATINGKKILTET